VPNTLATLPTSPRSHGLWYTCVCELPRKWIRDLTPRSHGLCYTCVCKIATYMIPRSMVHLCMRDCHVNEYGTWLPGPTDYVTLVYVRLPHTWSHGVWYTCVCELPRKWIWDLTPRSHGLCYTCVCKIATYMKMWHDSFVTDMNMWRDVLPQMSWHDSHIPQIMLHMCMRDCHVNEYVTWLIRHGHEQVTWLLCHTWEHVTWLPNPTDYGTPAKLCGMWVNYIRLPNRTDYTDSSCAHIWGGFGQ